MIELDKYKGTFRWVDEIIKENESLREKVARQQHIIETALCMGGAKHHVPLCSRCAEAIYSPYKKAQKT